ncbi:MAG: NAD(P)H-dependent oxidoreductase [bacterium]|nr:NAD(P)H-dependent oxidoreductase [bacterium]
MITIKILTGSTRPDRFNVQPVAWITSIAKKRKTIKTELVDLEKLQLPFLDEPMAPMMHKYSKEHTKHLSKIINDADGFIFVTPEYNHSYSAVLKNAIDYLFYEWNCKPVSFIGYGSIAGGSRGIEHLRGVAAELKMYDLRETILLPNYWENTDKDGTYHFNEQHEKAASDMLDSLIFWAERMKEARKLINAKK